MAVEVVEPVRGRWSSLNGEEGELEWVLEPVRGRCSLIANEGRRETTGEERVEGLGLKVVGSTMVREVVRVLVAVARDGLPAGALLRLRMVVVLALLGVVAGTEVLLAGELLLQGLIVVMGDLGPI